MRDRQHLQENLGAVDWVMDKEDVEKLRLDFPEKSNNSNATSVSII